MHFEHWNQLIEEYKRERARKEANKKRHGSHEKENKHAADHDSAADDPGKAGRK